MTREEEWRLVQAVLAGKKDAYEALVAANEKRIYTLMLRMTGSPEDAMDLSQEAFLRVYLSLRSYRGDSSFGVWMYRIAHNVCIDFLRRKQKFRITPLIFHSQEEGEKEREIEDPKPQPEAQVLQEERRAAVQKALLSLSNEHREILVMRDINGYSYQEIGAALGISEGTVKSRIARGRQKLAEILRKTGNFFEEAPSNQEEGGL